MDVYGFIVLGLSAVPRPTFLRWTRLASFLVLLGAVYLGLHSRTNSKCISDAHWNPLIQEPPRQDAMTRLPTPVRVTSQYVAVPDGTRLAVDVYLPSTWNEQSDTLPTFLHFTRYNRRYQIRWPFSLVLGKTYNSRSAKYVKQLVPHGYALVTADVRGTGASFGSRLVDLSPEETSDYVHVLDWAKEQSGCNGKFAVGGISYDGMAAAQLVAATHDRPDILAAVFLMNPVNLFEDLCLPGGLRCSGFMDAYGAFTLAAESGLPIPRDVPLNFFTRVLMNAVFEGPAAVDDDKESWALLHQALRQHKKTGISRHLCARLNSRVT